MDLGQKMVEVNKLKKVWEESQPLSNENAIRLWEKFRLEWSYNSNHIEGNTLTYGETKLLLIFDKTTGDHEKREYDEMEAHDVAVHLIRDWANDKERAITETDIRELNRIILVKPYWKEAITEDKQATRRKIKIGEYKEFPNHVELKNGEVYRYASPAETPAKMKDLIEWYRTTDYPHPLIRAAELHYRFVLIHPFDDGNGRIARLLMNYELMKYGYPPVIIKTKEKDKYLTALNKADSGDMAAFYEYITDNLLWSLDIAIKAALNESIEEPEDILKEIQQARNSIKTKAPKYSKRIDHLSVEVFVRQLVLPAFKYIVQHLDEFKDEFLTSNSKISLKVNQGGINVGSAENEELLERNLLNAILPHLDSNLNELEVTMVKGFNGFKYHESAPYMGAQLIFKFNDFYIECMGNLTENDRLKIAYNDEPSFELVINKCNNVIRDFINQRKRYS